MEKRTYAPHAAVARRGRASALAKALAEYGRLPKTRHMLNFISLDDSYRRRIRIQLNRGEGRHSLERAIFHGRRGEVREGYRDGQGEVLGALGFVTNVVVLWNTIYMDAALAHLESSGTLVAEADQERLSPLVFAHINFQGRFGFTCRKQLILDFIYLNPFNFCANSNGAQTI